MKASLWNREEFSGRHEISVVEIQPNVSKPSVLANLSGLNVEHGTSLVKHSYNLASLQIFVCLAILRELKNFLAYLNFFKPLVKMGSF